MVKIAFDPVVLQLGIFQLGWHGLFTALAITVAVWLGIRRAEAMGIPAYSLSGVATSAVVGGIVGARVFHVLDHMSYFAANPAGIFAVWQGGIAVYGAFLGGILGGSIAAARVGLPAWPLLDAAAPAMLVGQIIGRFGCLSNGDAWGEPTGGAWGLVYQNPNALLPPQLLEVPTHPYPIYEMAAVAILLGLLWLGRRRIRSPGATFLVAALGYAVIRFGLSFFRQEVVLIWGLQEAQLVALGTGVVAFLVLLLRWRGSHPPGLLPTEASNESGVRASGTPD